jgi:putative aldouronate transport system permease protein
MFKKNHAFNATLSDRIFDGTNTIMMILVAIVMLYPFLNVLALSFNDSTDTVRGGIYIWPRAFSLANFNAVFSFDGLLTGLKISILRTLIGTIVGLISASMIAFTLSRRDFQGRKSISLFLVLTMYFSGGLIPVYILIRDLHLMNTFAVYIFPGLVSAFNVFVIRSFIDSLPYELQESAKLDGANDFTIYWRVILPLCKPVLATIALFLAVGQWNSWIDTYLYNGSNAHLTTLQFELMKLLQSTQTGNGQDAHALNMTQMMQTVSTESVKMAITVVVTLPIVFIYPFLQRYFVKGMTLGAVKS